MEGKGTAALRNSPSSNHHNFITRRTGTLISQSPSKILRNNSDRDQGSTCIKYSFLKALDQSYIQGLLWKKFGIEN